MLKEKARQLPMSPGVYLMKDAHGAIIYVGKAKQLRQRVLSYFQKNSQHSKKTLRLIYNIADFDYLCVDTELDALLLECPLIQKYHPLYNRQLNFSRNYCYLEITAAGFAVVDDKTAGALGPFRWYKKIPEILEILAETYQMPWLPEITKIKIRAQLPEMNKKSLTAKIAAIQAFFEGENAEILQLLEKRITHLASQLNFEACNILQRDLAMLTYFFKTIRKQNWFLAQKQLLIALPVGQQLKYYQISYGRLVTTFLLPADQAPKLLPALLPRPLTKNEIDPLMILLNYYEKKADHE